MNGSKVDKRLTTGSLAIILFAELPITTEPGKRSFNHPAFRNDREATLSSWFLNDLDREIGIALGPLNEPFFIALIGTNRLQAWKAVMMVAQEPFRAFTLGNISWMYKHPQQQAIRINKDMPLASVYFFFRR